MKNDFERSLVKNVLRCSKIFFKILLILNSEKKQLFVHMFQKKNKSVIFLSTMHMTVNVIQTVTPQLEITKYYIQIKGAYNDTMDNC